MTLKTPVSRPPDTEKNCWEQGRRGRGLADVPSRGG